MSRSSKNSRAALLSAGPGCRPDVPGLHKSPHSQPVCDTRSFCQGPRVPAEGGHGPSPGRVCSPVLDPKSGQSCFREKLQLLVSEKKPGSRGRSCHASSCVEVAPHGVPDRGRRHHASGCPARPARSWSAGPTPAPWPGRTWAWGPTRPVSPGLLAGAPADGGEGEAVRVHAGPGGAEPRLLPRLRHARREVHLLRADRGEGRRGLGTAPGSRRGPRPTELRALRRQVPDGFTAVMSADTWEQRGPGVFSFHMSQPVPSYLVALAIGDLVSAEVGPR